MLAWLFRNTLLKLYYVGRRYCFSAVPFVPPTKVCVAGQDSFPVYVFFGVIDWHFRYQRPQQLAQTIAASGRRVIFVSPKFRDDLRAGFDVEEIDAPKAMCQIKLFLEKPGTIYSAELSDAKIKQLRDGVHRMRSWVDAESLVLIVQHAFWHYVTDSIPDCRLVYDCIDYHAGFGNNSNGLLRLEERLLERADITVTTSVWLDRVASKYTPNRVLIRNACDFEHFSCVPTEIFVDSKKRKIIGYYGAIASWFDQDLIEAIAEYFSDCSVLLVGADTVHARKRLAYLENVTFVGEVDYQDLPYYLHAFHVAILPFKVNELTLATNPVKVYEYLAAGRPVVAVKLPEMEAFENLVYTANSTGAFLEAIAEIFRHPTSNDNVAQRKNFASRQTWKHRAQELIDSVEGVST